MILAWENSRLLASNGLLSKRRLRNDNKNSIVMTCHYSNLGSASDWMKQIFNQTEAPPRPEWPVISMKSCSHSYHIISKKPVVESQNINCFLPQMPRFGICPWEEVVYNRFQQKVKLLGNSFWYFGWVATDGGSTLFIIPFTSKCGKVCDIFSKFYFVRFWKEIVRGKNTTEEIIGFHLHT